MRKISLLLVFFFTIYSNSHAEESIITYVPSQGIGNIAVKISLPETQRYDDGAPIVAEISTFFTSINKFSEGLDVTQIGCIHLSYLWPGKTDVATGVSSEGVYDYGGENCIAALKDVLRFACGEATDVQGRKIDEITSVTPMTNLVGLYAFSHPGIAAVNVLALYGDELSGIKYFVGRENPTNDVLSCVEIGHWGDNHEAILNPYYSYPDCYTDTVLNIDYSNVGWLVNESYPDGRPYFSVPNGPDYILGERIPKMWDKRYYSVQMISALIQNGALDPNNWPSELCTLEEAQRDWEFRSSIYRYSDIGAKLPDLKIMLVFAKDDHVHPALDKPHIHQAYNGFRKQHFWVRLNPDLSYVHSAKSDFESGFPDNPANSEPADWNQIRNWAYPNKSTSQIFVNLAAVAEMTDRVYYQNWSDNLDSVLQKVFPDQQTDVHSKPGHEFVPSRIELFSNYPNPFNSSTMISYQLRENSQVKLYIFNLSGEIVRDLVDRQESAGSHSIIWDGKDDRGNIVSSGIYFYQLKIDNNPMQTKKMMFLR